MEIKFVPEEIDGFYPPDYIVEGTKVLDIINNPSIGVDLINNSKYIKQKLRSQMHPNRIIIEFEIKNIELLKYCVQEMNNILECFNNGNKRSKKFKKKNYSISKYNILISLHAKYDIAIISFCTIVETYEMLCKGVCEEGPGVDFYLKISDGSLIRKNYMR